MGSPLMYESDPRDFGGKIHADNHIFFKEESNNILDLDPQEVAFNFEPFILNAGSGVPDPPVVTSPSSPVNNTQAATVSLTTLQSLSNQAPDTGPVFQTVPQMPPVQLFMQQEESSFPRNFDLTTENSVDIQALLAYTGLNIKDEKADDTPSCSLQSFQAELELNPSTVTDLPAQGPSQAAKDSAPGPAKKGKSKKRFPTKGSEEYKEKRARNNVAVRKSRTKAKQRQCETEGRVKVLTDENERLQKKVDLLSKELNVLKSLFLNVGAALPADFESVLQK